MEPCNIGVHWRLRNAQMLIPTYAKDHWEPLENVLRVGNDLVIHVTR